MGVVAVSLLLVGFSVTTGSASGFEGGSGTENDRYQIANVEQLQDIENDLTAHYVLVDNIDASETENWNENKGFNPIGDSDHPFLGSIDGQGFGIENLYIDRPETDFVGLFSEIADGTVKDIRLKHVKVIGGYCTGSLAGSNSEYDSPSIEKVHVIESTVSSNHHTIGGLLGYNEGNITESCFEGRVKGIGWTGGLVGRNNGSVSKSYFSGNITEGGLGTGGLIGKNNGPVIQSYSRVNMSISDSKIGGLIGHNRSGVVKNCYSQGEVIGKEDVGGLVGYNDEYGAEVINSFSTVEVTGDSYVGGLVGWNLGTVDNSFWDVETSGMTTSDGGTGKTTENMKNVRTFTDVDWSNGLDEAWDFVGNPYDDERVENIWDIDENGEINNGYPYLADLEPETSPVSPYKDNVLYVDNDWKGGSRVPSGLSYGDNAFEGIENAVDSSDSLENNKIVVRSGIYDNEIERFPITIDVKNLILVSEDGAPQTEIKVSTSSNPLRVSADNVEVNGFTLNGGQSGLSVHNSDNNIITNNISINHSQYGFDFWNSSYNMIENNRAENNKRGFDFYISYRDVVDNNLSINNSGDGFYFDNVQNCTIQNNLAQNNKGNGFYLQDSPNNILKYNLSKNNLIEYDGGGFLLEETSDNNSIINNISKNNSAEGFLIWSTSNTLENNQAIANGRGFYTDTSGNNGNNVFEKNLAENNESTGFTFWDSNNNIIENNISRHNSYCGFFFRFTSGCILENNLSVSNQYGIQLNPSTSNNVLKNNLIKNNDLGIWFNEASSNILKNNSVWINENGLFLDESNNNKIYHNNFENNTGIGIKIEKSDNNSIYLNDFVGNDINSFSEGSSNIWNSPNIVHYLYNNNEFSSYLGNYWDDYLGEDKDGDGIGDSPYWINHDQDNYPLVSLSKTYNISPEKMTPVEYYKSLEPSGEFSKQNVVQAIKDYFGEKEIPEIGRRLKKRDVVKLVKAYFDRVLP